MKIDLQFNELSMISPMKLIHTLELKAYFQLLFQILYHF